MTNIGVTGSLCRFIFIVLKTLLNYFQSSCTNLYSLQQWMRVCLFPRPLKSCYPLFVELSHSDWDKLKVEVVIKYKVLNFKNDEYFLICLPCLFYPLRTVHRIHSASCFQHLHLYCIMFYSEKITFQISIWGLWSTRFQFCPWW